MRERACRSGTCPTGHTSAVAGVSEKEPSQHFPLQVDGDLLKDRVCGLFIARKLKCTQPGASEHLSVLVSAGLLRGKAGQAVDVLQAGRGRFPQTEGGDFETVRASVKPRRMTLLTRQECRQQAGKPVLQRRHECRRCTQECVRNNILKGSPAAAQDEATERPGRRPDWRRWVCPSRSRGRNRPSPQSRFQCLPARYCQK
jgi:hypothetical protein